MALSAAADRAMKNPGKITSYPMDNAAQTIYKGGWVCLDATGMAVSGSQSGTLCVGVAVETKTVTAGGSDGDTEIRVYQEGDFLFTHTGGDAAATMVNDIMYINDDDSVDDAAGTQTGDVECGYIVKYVSTSQVWVRIDGYAPLPA